MAVLICGGCEKKPTESTRPWEEFSGENALQNVQRLVDFGPRPPGSDALEKSRDYITKQLEKSGWQVTKQSFTDDTPRGKVKFVNLIARRVSQDAKAGPFFLLCSHYDTKVFDSIRFLGANDSGSSTGALIEIARVLNGHPALATKTELVFFDGEEAYQSFSETDGLYGSRYFAKHLDGSKEDFSGGVLLDMIGDRSLTITLSPDSPAQMTVDIFASAEALKVRDHFTYFQSSIMDDHTPLNTAGIPTIDLIDFDFPPWHTADDTMDKLSAESLQTVGAVTLYYLSQFALSNASKVMRARTIAGLVLIALIAGGLSGEIIYRSMICRDAIGRCFGRGRLLAAIDGHGIYESDVKAEIAVNRYLAGSNVDPTPEDAVLSRLLANEALRQLSDRVTISESEVQHEFDLLRHEFADDKLWTTRMANTGISEQSLRQRVRENLAGRRLIEQELTRRLATDDGAVSRYYAQHLANFVQPMRLRVSHIFLAAPPETRPEIVQAKQKLVDSLVVRLRGGEDFEALVWEEAEDEASKPRGGDLGYLSQWRSLQDFFAAVSQLKIGETSKPFRSRLGFHIVRVTEIKPARQMTFAEARFEIAARLTNQRRRDAITDFAARLAGSSALRRSWFWN